MAAGYEPLIVPLEKLIDILFNDDKSAARATTSIRSWINELATSCMKFWLWHST